MQMDDVLVFLDAAVPDVSQGCFWNFICVSLSHDDSAYVRQSRSTDSE